MAYTDHYKLADDMIAHLDTVVYGIDDSFIVSRYVGFVAVVSVTVYELAIKEIFIEFGKQKHELLGRFTRSYFRRLNGRISTDDISNYIKRFVIDDVDDEERKKYISNCFKNKLEEFEKQMFHVDNKVSITTRYANILMWRNQFVHQGNILKTVNYNEAIESYKVGKEVIRCLAEFMHNDFDNL